MLILEKKKNVNFLVVSHARRHCLWPVGEDVSMVTWPKDVVMQFVAMHGRWYGVLCLPYGWLGCTLSVKAASLSVSLPDI